MSRTPDPTDAEPARSEVEVTPEFLAGIVESTFHPYVVLAKDGTVLYTSTAVVDLLGAPADQYIGKNMIDVIDHESREAAIAAFGEFTAPQRPDTGWVGPALTVKLRHVAGHLVTCRVLAVPSGNPGFDGLVLQLRVTESNRKLDAAIASMVRGDKITTTLSLILEFATEQMPDSVGIVGLGFDGRAFSSTVSDPRAPQLGGVPHLPLDVDPTPWGRVLAGEQRVDMAAEELPEPLQTAATQAALPTCWAFGLNTAGPPRDILVFWRRAPGPPGPHLTEAIERITRLIQLALEADRSRRLLEQQANTDELTGLANRAALADRLEDLRDHPPEQPFGILYCDLDDFKRINDRLGHTIGDHVLEIAARRIDSHVRAGDMAVRIGGDEFAVLCMDTSPDALGQLAERLVDAIAEPIRVKSHQIELGISVGAALLDPRVASGDPERVLERADAALLQAKASGKGRWQDSPAC